LDSLPTLAVRLAELEALEGPKPMMRGVLHQVFVFVAAAAAVTLIALAPTTRAIWAAGIYGFSLVALLGISATYHRNTWGPVARLFMQRLDHSAIFVLIAGTYTPICLLVLGSAGIPLLAVVWGGATLGVLQATFWPSAPKLLKASLYIGLGWVLVLQWSPLLAALTTFQLALLAAGGFAYTLGALVYAFQRPNPFPKTFGYHEVFHALVVGAAACHFIVMAEVVLSA
jgi:hemolysin III